VTNVSFLAHNVLSLYANHGLILFHQLFTTFDEAYMLYKSVSSMLTTGMMFQTSYLSLPPGIIPDRWQFSVYNLQLPLNLPFQAALFPHAQRDAFSFNSIF
jgi:hypothetical protein